jgi:hypothetical protein
MRDKNGTLVFENRRQQILFAEELVGQFSDGHWENTQPYDHWIPWAKCETKVAADGEPTGRDFWTIKDGYRLTDRNLLEVVGIRMRLYVRFWQMFPEAADVVYAGSHWDLPDPCLTDRNGLVKEWDELEAASRLEAALKKLNTEERALLAKMSNYSPHRMDYLMGKKAKLDAAGVTREMYFQVYDSLDKYPEAELKKDLQGVKRCMKTHRDSA